jgi:hypothetical protein
MTCNRLFYQPHRLFIIIKSNYTKNILNITSVWLNYAMFLYLWSYVPWFSDCVDSKLSCCWLELSAVMRSRLRYENLLYTIVCCNSLHQRTMRIYMAWSSRLVSLLAWLKYGAVIIKKPNEYVSLGFIYMFPATTKFPDRRIRRSAGS